MVPGFPGVNRPQIITWDGRILTLHLNYVAGYTGPLLFLFERTHNYCVDNQGLVPWRLRRVGRSKVRCHTLSVTGTKPVSVSVSNPDRNGSQAFFCCLAATQLARQVQQERTQVGCSNKVAQKRLARRHFRNGPWKEWQTHTHFIK